ncbi:hypothetical protein Tco_0183836 [Tanacetum coccineum]
MQRQSEKVDVEVKALDASLVDTESSRTTLKEQDTSNRLGNDSHVNDADIRPISDEEPMAEVQMTAEIKVFAIGQQHIEQPKLNNEGEVDQNAEQCHDTCPLSATLTDNQTTEFSNQSLKPTGRIFKTIGLRWVPTGKIFAFSTNKVDSEPVHGSIVDIPRIALYNESQSWDEDNNNDQATNASFQEAKFINPFCTRRSPLELSRGNPTMLVQTRRQLTTDPEMCMFALTVSIVEPKNIKEAMADSAWIEAMQDELH